MKKRRAPKFAKKLDASQTPALEDLKAVGYEFWVIHQPDDVLIRHRRWPLAVFTVMSFKTLKANGRERKRNDQPEQDAFCLAHGVQRVFDFDTALAFLRRFEMKLLGVIRDGEPIP